MARRGFKKRPVEKDPVYGQVSIAKLINLVMESGKKQLAQTIVYTALDTASKKKEMQPVELIDAVIDIVGPRFIVRARRVGGASYMVPREVTSSHRTFLALRWVVDAARERSNKEFKSFEEKLSAEFVDALDRKGSAYDKKAQSEKLAEANKVFAHFNW